MSLVRLKMLTKLRVKFSLIIQTKSFNFQVTTPIMFCIVQELRIKVLRL